MKIKNGMLIIVDKKDIVNNIFIIPDNVKTIKKGVFKNYRSLEIILSESIDNTEELSSYSSKFKRIKAEKIS